MEQPIGDTGTGNGTVTAVECSGCGHVGEPTGRGQCAACGCFVSGNTCSVVVGHHGSRFWIEHARARGELRDDVIRDAGHDPDDHPPRALELAADSVAQAAIVQSSAYERMLDAGGPLTSAGRARRAFKVWCRATDRLERHLRMVGLERRAREVGTPLEAVKRAVEEANAE